MRLYIILEAPNGKPENVAFVREGFSYTAFLFTVLWALWHRMWVVGLFLFALSSGLTIAANFEVLGPGLASLIQFAIGVLFGFEARSLQLAALERAGFRRVGLIQASSQEAAELTYFAGRSPVASASEPAPRRLRATSDDTLGIFGNV